MPEYKNVATVEIETGYEDFEWPEDEYDLEGTWWVDEDGDLGIVREFNGRFRLFFAERCLSWIPLSALQSQVRQGQACPVAVTITARRVGP